MVDSPHAVAVAVPLRIVGVESSVAAEVDRNRSTGSSNNDTGRNYRTEGESELPSMSERVL
jgi:hypothetical protein